MDLELSRIVQYSGLPPLLIRLFFHSLYSRFVFLSQQQLELSFCQMNSIISITLRGGAESN